MIASQPGLLSRRRLLAVGAVLALPCGCAVPLRSIRDVDLDAIGPAQALLLGRIRLTILDFDRTGDAFIRTNASEDEILLPPEGDVAWVVPRPASADIRLSRFSSSLKTVRLGQGPVLAPHAVRTAINYFGTIDIELEHGPKNNRASERTGQLGIEIVDDQKLTMRAFVEQNPRLAGRIYYHVLRGTILEAPQLPARSPQGHL
jgi:hypothetical protein